MSAILGRLPEMGVVALGFPTSAVWEFLQSPLYADDQRGFAYVVRTRLHCAAGDVLILFASFLLTAFLFRSRGWVFTRRAFPRAIFLAAGLGYTIWSEWFHTRVALSWSYSGRMPTLFGIGVAPVLQWIVVPSLVLFGLRRLRGQARGDSRNRDA